MVSPNPSSSIHCSQFVPGSHFLPYRHVLSAIEAYYKTAVPSDRAQRHYLMQRLSPNASSMMFTLYLRNSR